MKQNKTGRRQIATTRRGRRRLSSQLGHRKRSKIRLEEIRLHLCFQRRTSFASVDIRTQCKIRLRMNRFGLNVIYWGNMVSFVIVLFFRVMIESWGLFLL